MGEEDGANVGDAVCGRVVGCRDGCMEGWLVGNEFG